MEVRRKKAFNLIITVAILPAIIMFFAASTYGIFTRSSFLEKLFCLVFLAISVVGLRSFFFSLSKIFSIYPEFELTKDTLLIYDNPHYDKIPFSEMLGCKTYYPPKSSGMIGISIKPDSKIVGNSNIIKDFIYNLSKDSKMVFLSLEYADIDHEYLVDLIKQKIAENAVQPIA